MKSKLLLSSLYIGIVWLIIVFIFGKAGILDNMYQEKEVIRLTEASEQSQAELEKMTQEYYRLSSMKKPTQAFLIDQGRKTKNIIVFKMNTENTVAFQDKISIAQEKQLFLQITIIAILIVLMGFMGIFIISYVSKKKKNKEFENPKEEIVDDIL